MGWVLVDLLILAVAGFYGYRGYLRGVVKEGMDLAGFLAGMALALKLYPYAGAPLRWVGVGKGWAHFAGGATVMALVMTGAILLTRRLHSHPRLSAKLSPPLKAGGAIFGAAWSGLLMIFLLVVLTVLPAPRAVQMAVRESVTGRILLVSDSPVYGALAGYARRDARNLLIYLRQYFTYARPDRTLNEGDFFKITPSSDIEIAGGAERAIINLVNRERVKRGLALLALHAEIRSVARKHSADMYRRGYFAHANPDGQDPFDRMRDGGVRFVFAGENLALAPSVELVHRGLMNSPRHRSNILKKEFTDLGIGVYRGPYGLMVTQNFCAGCRAGSRSAESG